MLINTYDMIEELAKLKGEIPGVPTGFIDLDSLLTGLHKGELVILGARPAMGGSGGPARSGLVRKMSKSSQEYNI